MTAMYDGVDTRVPVLCLGCVVGVLDLPHQCAGAAELRPTGGYCGCTRPGCGPDANPAGVRQPTTPSMTTP